MTPRARAASEINGSAGCGAASAAVDRLDIDAPVFDDGAASGRGVVECWRLLAGLVLGLGVVVTVLRIYAGAAAAAFWLGLGVALMALAARAGRVLPPRRREGAALASFGRTASGSKGEAQMTLQRVAGIVLLVIGLSLLIAGLRASDSIASQFSQFFTGSPTDRSVWLTLGGIAAMLTGAILMVAPARISGR